MKVAFTSTTGERIDEHFGHCRDFHIWEITADVAGPCAVLSGITATGDEEDRIAARAAALADCAIVYTMQIGGPAAAKLVARKIYPMKTACVVPIAEIVARLQDVLRGSPPPWLKKALAKDAGSTFSPA